MASQSTTSTSRLAQIQNSEKLFNWDSASNSNSGLSIKNDIHNIALARFSSDGALNNNYHHLVSTKLNESWAGRRLFEALNQLPPSKFGSSTDMRFQQKQLQVREQRKMEMTASKSDMMESEPINDKSNTSTKLGSSIGNGKVRQMFNERRRGAGIDRSNPLKPITSRSSSSSSTITPTSISSKTNNVRKMDRIIKNKISVLKTSNDNDSVDYINNENNLEKYGVNEVDIESGTFSEQKFDNFDTVLPSKLEALILDNFGEDSNNNHMSESNTKLNSSIKLNPVLTKKPAPIATKTPAKTSRSSLNLTSKNNSTLSSSQKLVPATSKNSNNVKSSSKMAKPLTSSNVISLRVPRAKTPPSQPPGTAPCKLCNRFFSEDRLAKHEDVCEKMAMKKRKIFDASKHRVKGTEAEKYLKKPLRGVRTVGKNTSTVSTNTNSSTDASAKKNNWRKKHEEFIAAIRAAKEVQAHLAKGGKLSDLPPPPPSENLDYIACPHCSRRFNEAAANRHIPKCANMLHNKPKPAAKRR